MWLGIDIGTGGTRALLVDAEGRVRAGYTAAHEEMRMERPLWAEQRPENWWDASVDGGSRRCWPPPGVSGSDVNAIGLSGQMHGLVMLDDARQRDPSGAHLVRSAHPAAGGCGPRETGPRKRSALHRQSGADRLHAAQTALGARP